MLFDLHVHSRYSVRDSTSDITEILLRAVDVGLNGVAVTDHNAVQGSLDALELAKREEFKGLMVIPGIEVSSLDGHIVCLGVTEVIARDMGAEETIERAHELGGIAIAAHPYDRFRSGVGDLCHELDFDAVEINGHCLWGNSKAAEAAKKHDRPLVGGSDAHSISGIGTIVTKTREEISELEDLFDDIKSGRCKPIKRKNHLAHKAYIIADKVARQYGKRRRL